MHYQFTDDCMIGIPKIDEEHRQLFQLVNELQDILDKADSSQLRTLSVSVLKKLVDYTIKHFSNEEAYMESIHDPELAHQKEEHASFVARINQTDLSGFSDSALRYALLDLLNYLVHWLFGHILGSDIMIGKFQSPFSFTNEYLTGVEQIDTEHRQLFAIIKEANDLIHADLLHDKYDAIMAVLSKLKDYTVKHFQHEEAYMKEIGYPGLVAQQYAHTSFCDKLNEINLDEMDDNQQAYLEELVDFLLNWLIVHILKMDKKIGEYAASLN